VVLLQAGNLREAREEFIDAVRLKPRYAEAHYNLARALHQEGHEVEGHEVDEVESRVEFDKAYEIRFAGSALKGKLGANFLTQAIT
jgi:tetratricopeptide (TPR) repeat protein